MEFTTGLASALQLATLFSDALPSSTLPQSAQTAIPMPGIGFGEICSALLENLTIKTGRRENIAGNEVSGRKAEAKEPKEKSASPDAGNSATLQVALLPQLVAPALPSNEAAAVGPLNDVSDDLSMLQAEPASALDSAPVPNGRVLPRISGSESFKAVSTLVSNLSSSTQKLEVNTIPNSSSPTTGQCVSVERSDASTAVENAKSVARLDLQSGEVKQDRLASVTLANDDWPADLNSTTLDSGKDFRIALSPEMKATDLSPDKAVPQSKIQTAKPVGVKACTQEDGASELSRPTPQQAETSEVVSPKSHSGSVHQFRATFTTARELMKMDPGSKSTICEPQWPQSSVAHDLTSAQDSGTSPVRPAPSADLSSTAQVQLAQSNNSGPSKPTEKNLEAWSGFLVDNSSQDTQRAAPETQNPAVASASNSNESGHSRIKGAAEVRSQRYSSNEKAPEPSDSGPTAPIGPDGAIPPFLIPPARSVSLTHQPTSNPKETNESSGATVTYEYPVESARGAMPLTNQAPLARLLNHTAQTEMRIGLNTPAFGSIEVRTVVHATDVGVQIGSERGDLRSMIATELPSLAHSLEQQNLRLSHVEFNNGGSTTSHDSMPGGNSHGWTFTAQARADDSAPDFFAHDSPENPEPQYRGEGLSILA